MEISISKKSILLILTLILVSIFFMMAIPVSADNPIFVVDDDFNDTTPGWNITHFNDIQNGINTISENETLYVNNGFYKGDITVYKTISIIGENKDSVRILGSIYVNSNNVLIEKMTIANVSGGDFPSGIYDESSNSKYRYLRLLNNTNGIQLSYLSYNTTIIENLFEENNYGIYSIETSPYALIINNTFRNNTYGIFIDSSEFYTVFHNIIVNNTVAGVSLISSNNNIIYDNFFDNLLNADSKGGMNNLWNVSKTSGINIIGGPYLGGNFWSDYIGLDVDGDSLGDIVYNINLIIEEKDEHPLKYPNHKLYVDDDANPIWYDDIHVRTIQEAINNASNEAEIFINNGTYLENIQITKTVSIFGESKSSVLISNAEWGNTFTILSSGITIQNLTINDNQGEEGAGSAIYDVSSNSYYSNLHIYNNTYGIYFTSESSGSVVTNNLILNNTVGIIHWYSGNSLIYNNYFDNIKNCEIYSEEVITNHWNVTKTPGINIIGGINLGGNYWSDYSGMDVDSDGIGESVYFIDDSYLYIDYLPLTDKINFPPVLGSPKPIDGSSNNPLVLDWSIEINDSEWGVFDWYILCSNGQSEHSFESLNGTKILHLTGLSYGTTYRIWVNVTDYYSWTNETFTFTTKAKKLRRNSPPVAIIDGVFVGYPGESINFDGSQSYDSDGYITTYNWDLGDGTTLQGKFISHHYSKQGIYNLSLTVFDNKKFSNTAVVKIIIIKANNPPELNLTLEKTLYVLNAKLTITVLDKDGDDIRCTINWDDNSSPKILQLSSNQTITETHKYLAYGNYMIHVSANDGSTETSETVFITFTKDNISKENMTFNGFIELISNNKTFLDNKIDSRSILGGHFDKQYTIIIATILSIFLLFLLNFLIEFFSDYSSERTIEYRKKRKNRFSLKKKEHVQLSKFISWNEIIAIIIATFLLSFVLSWTWSPNFEIFWETFIVFLIIVAIIFFIRETLRSYLCCKLKFHSEYYVWPLGAVMMIVSTAIGNTFSLSANHHYNGEDIKKCGKVSFIVSIILYIIVFIAFLINLFYNSAILQMIIIVTILNLFIDLFPLNPMDGYEIRHWNIYLWAIIYIVVLISYVTVYFNIYP
jgi:parallel beta-helix repeat protein